MPGTGKRIKLVLLWIVSYRRKPVSLLTYAISGNVVGGVGEFGEFDEGCLQWTGCESNPQPIGYESDSDTLPQGLF